MNVKLNLDKYKQLYNIKNKLHSIVKEISRNVLINCKHMINSITNF